MNDNDDYIESPKYDSGIGVGIKKHDVLSEIRGLQAAGLQSRGRDNVFRDREINSQLTTNNLQLTTHFAGREPDANESGQTTPSELSFESKASNTSSERLVTQNASVVGIAESTMRDQISGILIQKKKNTKKSIVFYLTIQFTHQVTSNQADQYSAWLKPRSRGREFNPETDFEKQIYDLTVEHKDWYLGRLTERGAGGQIVESIAVTFDPDNNEMMLWFSDYSDCIQIQTNNGILTEQQIPFFETTGHYGNEVVIKKQRAQFGKSRSVVGGN